MNTRFVAREVVEAHEHRNVQVRARHAEVSKGNQTRSVGDTPQRPLELCNASIADLKPQRAALEAGQVALVADLCHQEQTVEPARAVAVHDDRLQSSQPITSHEQRYVDR